MIEFISNITCFMCGSDCNLANVKYKGHEMIMCKECMQSTSEAIEKGAQ